MLPGGEAAPHSAETGIISSTSPSRQLSELPKDELEHLAEEYGLDPHEYKTRQHLVAAIHDRRQMIAATDRDAMLDVVKWGRRPVSLNASKEQLAQEIVRIRSMRFGGLSQRGLVILSRMRGLSIPADAPIPQLVKKLKKQEGIFSKLNRKRRAMLGALVSGIIGNNDSGEAYQFLPPQQGGPSPSGGGHAAPSASPTIKEEIEESGLFGGIAGRIKKSADSYVNQKLDEIESRIDRKLDEIDRRLAEWRDKEIANRIRILKITLWASVIVGAGSLLYSYIRVYFAH
jgi:hypothetical protein